MSNEDTKPQEIPQAISPKLTPLQELNLKYNKLCATRGEIEFKVLNAEEAKHKIEEELERLGHQRTSNAKNMRDLQKEAIKLGPTQPATETTTPSTDATQIATPSA